MERISNTWTGGWPADKVAGRPEGTSTEADGAAASYLEQSCNTVTDTYERISDTLKVKSCGCRSRFCPRCCAPLAYSLRERLIPILSTFKSVFMLTLTVDPTLFVSDQLPCPELAYFYIRDKRCVARLVKTLFKSGHLATDRYFYVVEWQKDTEFPHYHLVLDADYIPFDALCDAWNAFRPPWAPSPLEGRPGFGSVRFTSGAHQGTRSAEACARYVCKYLTKYPAHGYPDWVLDADYRIRRFSSSRGFWGIHRQPRDTSGWAGREDETAVQIEQGELPIEHERPMTIRQRTAGCGQMSAVFRETELVNLRTGELTTRDEFICMIGQSISAIGERLEKVEVPNPYILIVRDPVAMLRLGELMPSRVGGGGG